MLTYSNSSVCVMFFFFLNLFCIVCAMDAKVQAFNLLFGERTIVGPLRFGVGDWKAPMQQRGQLSIISYVLISQSKLPNYSDILWAVLFLSGMREKWCSWSCLQHRTTNVRFTRHVMSSIISCEPWHGRLWSGSSAQIYSGESLRSHCGWSERYSSTQHQGYGSIWAAFPGHVL